MSHSCVASDAIGLRLVQHSLVVKHCSKGTECLPLRLQCKDIGTRLVLLIPQHVICIEQCVLQLEMCCSLPCSYSATTCQMTDV